MKKLRLFLVILPIFVLVLLFKTAVPVSAADCGTPPAPYPQCGAEAGACVGAPYASNHTVVVTTTFDADCNKVYGCEDKGVLPGQCGNPGGGGGTCTLNLTPVCGATNFTSNSLKASWNLGAHQPSNRCHVVVWGGRSGTPGYVNWDKWDQCSGTDVSVPDVTQGFTDDGDYSIQISNDEAGCNPSGIVTKKFACRQNKACSGNACNDCIITQRTDLLPFYQSNGWDISCTNQSKIVADWCTKVDPTGCASIKSGQCVTQCGGSPAPSGSGGPGNCPADSKLTITPPSPKVGDAMTFQYQAGEDVYIGGDTWSGGVNPNPCTLDSNLGNRRYTCTAQSAVTNATWKHYWGSPKTCGSATYTITSPAATTVSYRIAENPVDLAAAPWQDYTDTVASTPRDYTFKDPKPGQKFIFVQFKDSNGKIGGCGVDQSQSCQTQIKLLGPDPAMTGCSLSFEANNTILNLTGQNFGSTKGTIKSGDTDLVIRSWKDDSIQAILQNAPTGQVLPVTFANTDGQTGSGECSSISQLTLGAKVFCRAPASYDTDNVDLTLVDETGKKMRQTVRIDKKGVVQGLTQRLEDGKRYELSLKAPKSLRRNVPFTAGDGTVSIPNFVLPVGDIFPLDGGDGAINALDKGELNREWNISGNATGRLGDFNQDGRVNSIDWACMRYDFGQSDDPEATIPPSPSPSPAPSASASASPSPRASVSPSPSPKLSP